MKKRFINYFVILFMLVLPIVIYAANLTSYGESVTKANNYINSFNDRRKYLIFNKNYVYEKTGFGDSSLFLTGGMLSKSEYDLSIYMNQSYLASGKEYWTLTSSGSNQYYVDAYIQTKSIDSNSGTRVTQYIKPSTSIEGAGTFANPWTFGEGIEVDIISNNTNFGTVSPTGPQYVTPGSDVRYTLTPSNGYFYNGIKDDCHLIKEGVNKYENIYLVQSVDKDIKCTAVYELRTYKFDLSTDPNSTDFEGNPKEYTTLPNPKPIYYKYKTNWYSDEGTNNVLTKITPPTMTGWTFAGYYYGDVKVIDDDGTILTKNLDLGTTNDYVDTDHELVAADANFNPRRIGFDKNTYKIKFNLNGGKLDGNANPPVKTVKYDEKVTINYPTKAGYAFAGWKHNGNSSTAMSGSGSSVQSFAANSTVSMATVFANLTSSLNGEVTMTATWSICSAGTYSDGSSPTCTACPAGSYTTSTGQTSCKTCEDGYYCTGGTNHSSCPVGTEGTGEGKTSEADGCSKCAAGKYAENVATQTCSTCSAGTYSAEGASSCTSCSAGTYSGAGAASCTSCGAGYYSAAGAGSCTKCNAGTYSGAGAASCTSCGAGYYSAAGASVCTKCGAGYYSAAGASSCTKCNAGTYSGSGAASCTSCSAGYYSAAGASGCTKCNAGTYSGSGAASCTSCSAGYYSAAGATSCTKCNAGTYSGSGAASCTSCSAGYYSAAGASGCTKCNAGTYSAAGAASCKSCDAGYYSAAGATSCTKCNAGTYSAAGASSCPSCSAGYYSAAGASSCTKCNAGTYSAAGASSCPSCSAGYYSAAGASSCTKCNAGTYSAAGASGCTKCGDGYYSAAGASSCTKCNAGTYSAAGASSCKSCDAGYYSAAGAGSCTKCTAGYYSAAGASSCKSCDAGYYSAAGASSCTKCGANQYSAAGASSCSNCPSGYSSSAGSSRCSKYDTCRTGSNTCQGGYNQVWSECATGADTRTWGDVCQGWTTGYSITHCGYDSSKFGSCTLSVNDGNSETRYCENCKPGLWRCAPAKKCKYCSGGYKYGVTGGTNTCKAGYVNGTWNDCLTGSNTCAAGYWYYPS